MSRLRVGIALTAWLAAGCASAPDELGPAASTPVLPQAQLAASQVAASQDGLQPVSVDASAIDPRGQIICQDLLKHGSNVIITQCLTREGWKRFKQAQAMRAQQMLRAMQGSPYR